MGCKGSKPKKQPRADPAAQRVADRVITSVINDACVTMKSNEGTDAKETGEEDEAENEGLKAEDSSIAKGLTKKEQKARKRAEAKRLKEEKKAEAKQAKEKKKREKNMKRFEKERRRTQRDIRRQKAKSTRSIVSSASVASEQDTPAHFQTTDWAEPAEVELVDNVLANASSSNNDGDKSDDTAPTGGHRRDSLTSGNWVYLTQEEEKRIEAYHKKNQTFQLIDLQRIFAAVKENGGGLGRSEFAIVYVSYSREANVELAGSVFDMFDTNNNGLFEFEEFVDCLTVMTRSSPTERAEYCFNLYDKDHSGFLSRENLVDMLSKMPVDMILHDHDIMHNHSHNLTSTLGSLPELIEEDETEEAEEAAAEEAKRLSVLEEKKEVEADLVSRYRSMRASRHGAPKLPPLGEDDDGTASDALVETKSAASRKPFRPRSTREHNEGKNRKRAEEVVDQIFEEMGYKKQSMTKQEFIEKVGTSKTLAAFFPF